MTNATYRGRALTIPATITGAPSWTVLVPGQPMPTGCGPRTSEVLYLLVSGSYYRARDVGCDVGGWGAVTRLPGTPQPPPTG